MNLINSLLADRSQMKLTKHMNSRHGSSLILVLLVIAGILTVVFGAQRVTLVQFSQSNREEDNVAAYYAARAGIEDGLIRYRFSRNAETEASKVYRYNISAGESFGEVSATSNIDSVAGYKPTNQYYDLTMNFKTNNINMLGGNPNFSNNQRLADGDFLELTGFSDSGTYFLHYAFRFYNPNSDTLCTDSRALVQLESRSESGKLVEFQAPRPSDNIYNSAPNANNIPINNTASLTSSVRLRAYYCDVQYAFNTAETEQSTGSTPGPTFDSLTANITGIGYYGAAKRTLQATVDRNTGRLIDIYDFNAFAGTGNIN